MRRLEWAATVTACDPWAGDFLWFDEEERTWQVDVDADGTAYTYCADYSPYGRPLHVGELP